jgi:allantoate deiminase
MVAAAELVVTLESLCKDPSRFLTYDEECGCFTEESLAGLVCTVGELLTWPSASNVIPGQVSSLSPPTSSQLDRLPMQ